MKKLINWKDMPLGVSVTNKSSGLTGVLVCHALDKDLLYIRTEHIASETMGYRTIRERTSEEVKLALVNYQEWIPYEEGITVIPEWLEVMYKIAVPHDYDKARIEVAKEYEYQDGIPTNTIAAYRVGSYATGKLLKEGWADNPREVK